MRVLRARTGSGLYSVGHNASSSTSNSENASQLSAPKFPFRAIAPFDDIATHVTEPIDDAEHHVADLVHGEHARAESETENGVAVRILGVGLALEGHALLGERRDDRRHVAGIGDDDLAGELCRFGRRKSEGIVNRSHGLFLLV